MTATLSTLVVCEARRLARHPALWLPLAVALAGVAKAAVSSARFQAGSWYAGVFVTIAMIGPIVAIFAANLVASNARRTRAEEMLSVTPTADTERTLAMCLGVALTLAGIGCVTAFGMAFIAAGGSLGTGEMLAAGELAQIPVILAAGGLLGVLTARWLRFPGAVLVAFAVFVIGVLVFDRAGSETRWWLWWYTATPMDSLAADITSQPLRPASAAQAWWHTAYLVGLCACLAVAAVYRGRWRRP